MYWATSMRLLCVLLLWAFIKFFSLLSLVLSKDYSAALQARMCVYDFYDKDRIEEKVR